MVTSDRTASDRSSAPSDSWPIPIVSSQNVGRAAAVSIFLARAQRALLAARFGPVVDRHLGCE